MLWALGERLLVSTDATGTTVFGDAAGLGRAVHTARSMTDYPNGVACEDLICAYTGDGRMTGIDPATLTERWSVPSGYSAWHDGRLLTFHPEDTPRIERSDPVTGQVSGQIIGWDLAPGPLPAFYVRHKEAGGRIWFGVLDERRFLIRPLAVADGVTDECQIAAGALVCRKIDASVAVWRLR